MLQSLFTAHRYLNPVILARQITRQRTGRLRLDAEADRLQAEELTKLPGESVPAELQRRYWTYLLERRAHGSRSDEIVEQAQPAIMNMLRQVVDRVNDLAVRVETPEEARRRG